MPCYNCGTRQVDPDRGCNPWMRGVRVGRQILVCPDCQAAGDWTADLDHCPVCASIHLVRRLGEVECRDCGTVESGTVESGAVGSGAADGESAAGSSAVTGDASGLAARDGVPPGLAEEVEQALARVLRRSARTAGIG
jgi:uncharacterized Zn finger protein (UPF0148 family)